MCHQLCILHCNLNKEMISKVFNIIAQKYKSNHVITFVEVEHGRNHLITGH
jgi:hypothetical protein